MGHPTLQEQILQSAVAQFPVIGEQLGRPQGLSGGTVGVVVGTLFDQDVPRLDIPVHQAMPVRRVQSPACLADQRQRLVRRDDMARLENRP